MVVDTVRIAIVGSGITGLNLAHKILGNEFRVSFPYCHYTVDLYEFREYERNQIIMNGIDIHYEKFMDYDFDQGVQFVQDNVKFNRSDRDITPQDMTTSRKGVACQIKKLQEFLTKQLDNRPITFKKTKVDSLDTLKSYDLVFATDGSNSSLQKLCGIHTCTSTLSYALTATWTSNRKQSKFSVENNKFRYFNVNDNHYGAVQLTGESDLEASYGISFKDAMSRFSDDVGELCTFFEIPISELRKATFNIVPVTYKESSQVVHLIDKHIPCIFMGDSLLSLHFFSGSAIPIHTEIMNKIFKILYETQHYGSLMDAVEMLVDRKSLRDQMNQILTSYDLYYKMKAYV